jgi:hypothetical protein
MNPVRAERALRPPVNDCKLTGGFHFAWGSHTHAALASFRDTANVRGQSGFETHVAVISLPLLLYLTCAGYWLHPRRSWLLPMVLQLHWAT